MGPVVASILLPLLVGLTPDNGHKFVMINGAEPGTWEDETGELIMGFDQVAARIWREAGGTVIEYPADWGRYQRRAGPIRTGQMVTEGDADLCIGFPWFENFYGSPGTKNCMDRADAYGIPTFRVLADGTIERWGKTWGMPGLWPYQRTDDIPAGMLRTALQGDKRP